MRSIRDFTWKSRVVKVFSDRKSSIRHALLITYLNTCELSVEARARLVGVSRPESHVTKFRQDRPNAVSLALVTNQAVRDESKGAIDARPGDCHVMPLAVAHGHVLGELEQKNQIRTYNHLL